MEKEIVIILLLIAIYFILPGNTKEKTSRTNRFKPGKFSKPPIPSKPEVNRKEKRMKKFSITGKFDDISRDKFIEEMENIGCKFQEEVHDKLDFIVIARHPGSKIIKARAMGIPSINSNLGQKIINLK